MGIVKDISVYIAHIFPGACLIQLVVRMCEGGRVAPIRISTLHKLQAAALETEVGRADR
jgi:hypothetical protein